MINVSFRPRLGVTFKKVRKGVNDEHQLFSSELLEQVRAATPIKDGRARRGWSERKMGDKIRVTNRIPYIERLESNFSKQTRGKGIIKPAVTRTKSNRRRVR